MIIPIPPTRFAVQALERGTSNVRHIGAEWRVKAKVSTFIYLLPPCRKQEHLGVVRPFVGFWWCAEAPVCQDFVER